MRELIHARLFYGNEKKYIEEEQLPKKKVSAAEIKI